MPLRERLKNFKGRLEKARQALGSEDGLAQPTSSLSKVKNVQPTINPALESPTTPVASGSIPEPAAAPSTSETTRPDQTWACLMTFLRILDNCSGAFGPLRMVIDGLIQCINMHEDAAAARRDYKELKAQLEALFSDLSAHFSGNIPPTMTSSMDNLCTAIAREIDRISGKGGGETGRRHLGAEKDLDNVTECYRRIRGHLQRLTLNTDLNIWKIVDEQATETRLKSLMPSMSACYNSAESALVRRRECTPHTREQVLAELSRWRHDKNQRNLYWLNGMAGTGKTTIANSLCAMLDRAHELGASFFCTRLLPECRNVKLIIPTIAYQLARFSRPFRCALSRALERDPDVHTRVLSNQLDSLIVGPLREVQYTLPADLVVVIDALDECDDGCGVEQILEMLARHASELPIKIFVSSRPEPQIREKIGSTKSQLILHELDKSIVKEDIETYLRTELACMALSESQLAALVERAGVLFIYAATATRYIGENNFSLNPKRRLENVLEASASYSSNKNQEIDELYALILCSALDSPKLEEPDKVEMKLVLHTVICAQEPLTVNAIGGLLRLDDPDLVHSALRSLWSVLHISGASELVTTLHASFPDYMLDSNRSKGYCCDAEAHHSRLAELCFERIKRNERQFNICELESSYLFDEQVPQLNERVNKAIPQDLMYACQYWATHLQLGAWSNRCMQLLCEFLSTRLLLWMEVLNLKKRMDIGAVLPEKAREWCMRDNSQELVDLVHDAWRFITMYAANPVSRSTPHIYTSMLVFWPRSRLLSECYIQRSRRLAQVEGTGLTRRQLALLSSFTVHGGVCSLALSPDGMCFASGSGDGTVGIWDAQNGQVILGPLVGHTGTVSSVAFSPDSKRIVSGSSDSTICIWDAQNGRLILGPLEGHTGVVTSVAFSSGGACIISGSLDSTIRVWDAQNGQLVHRPFEGHTGKVNSIALSSDSMYIVSGLSDGTICTWGAQNRLLVLGPPKGQVNEVDSVALSPDCTRVTSGYSDGTICIWDVQSGQMVLGPLKGHTGPVLSVAFSPNGMQIVSGSFDSKICVWDVHSGQLVQSPLEGHTGTVNSVSFSPNGMRIISGSNDFTVCIWDARNETVNQEPLEGHTDTVSSVAFSPDRTRVVSGSLDATICIWDAHNGQLLLGPLKGHSGTVCSVAFSPDGIYIVTGAYNPAICIWDAQSGHLVQGLHGGHTEWVNSVVFSPDGMRIVSGSDDYTICLWNTKDGQMILGPLERHTGAVTSVAFSPDGVRIISGSSDHTICVWDVQNGHLVLGPLEGHTGVVSSVAFSPDGTCILSGSYDSTMRLWDAHHGQLVQGPLEGHNGAVMSVAFAPDGKHIVSGSLDHTIRIWNVQCGQMVLGPLEGHTNWVISVAFSSNGTRVVSGSADKVVRIWSVKNQQDPTNPVPNQAHSTISAQSIFETSSRGSWVIDAHGWVLDKHERLCLWVPPDLRACLLVPGNPLLMSAQGSVRLTFDNASIGESWVECYSPV